MSSQRLLYHRWGARLVEMVVVKLVVRVVVAKGHRGERKKKRWQRRKGWGGKDFFFFRLWTQFSLFQTMKSKSIYRGWERDLWSPLVPNIGPRFDPKVSLLLVKNGNDKLSVLCKKIAGRVGHFRAVPLPLQPQSARTVHTGV